MVSINNNELHIQPDSASFYKAAADDFMQRAQQGVDQRGVFNVVLSGGNTPKKFFDLLTTEPYHSGVPWENIQFFFGDERYVPADQQNNNYYMAHQHLFTKVAVLTQNVYLIPTEYIEPDVAAEDYANTIRKVLKVKDKEMPEFDLLYLGLGSNAHTASLMPHTDIVKMYAGNVSKKEERKLVEALWVKELNMNRITLTPPVINNSACIVFMAEGDEKATPVWQILEGPHDPVTYPAQLIKAEHGSVIWFLDKAAAAKLKTV